MGSGVSPERHFDPVALLAFRAGLALALVAPRGLNPELPALRLTAVPAVLSFVGDYRGPIPVVQVVFRGLWTPES
jgi:hypothetical protein